MIVYRLPLFIRKTSCSTLLTSSQRSHVLRGLIGVDLTELNNVLYETFGELLLSEWRLRCDDDISGFGRVQPDDSQTAGE